MMRFSSHHLPQHKKLKKERKKRPRLTHTAAPVKTKKSRAQVKAEEEAKALPAWEATSPLYPPTADEDIGYPLDLPPVSQIDLLCFEVDEEVFEETKKKIVHMTEEEIDKYIKSFFKYSCYRPMLQKRNLRRDLLSRGFGYIGIHRNPKRSSTNNR